MKLLIVTNTFPPAHIGGYEIACRDTIELLNAAGHVCHVLTSDLGAQSLRDYDSDASNTIERTMLLHHNWGSSYAVVPFDAVQHHNHERLSEAIARVKPEIIYFWNLYGLGWKLLQALDQSGAPPATFHFMDLSVMAYQRTFRKLLSSVCGRGDAIWGNVRPKIRNALFISRFIRQQLGVSPSHESTIYPYLRADGTPKKQDYRLGEMIRSVFIGQLEPHKGIFFLCETLKSYRQDTGRDVRLDVFGLSRNGNDKLLLEKFGEFVSVMTNVDRESLLQRLSGYDLGFFPSLWEEPFGIAQIEMMLAGLPVVSSGRGGSVEVYNGQNLLLYQHDSREALRERLHGLLSCYEETAPALGARAREYVLRHHGVEQYLAALEMHFQKVLDRAYAPATI